MRLTNTILHPLIDSTSRRSQRLCEQCGTPLSIADRSGTSAICARLSDDASALRGSEKRRDDAVGASSPCCRTLVSDKSYAAQSPTGIGVGCPAGAEIGLVVRTAPALRKCFPPAKARGRTVPRPSPAGPWRRKVYFPGTLTTWGVCVSRCHVCELYGALLCDSRPDRIGSARVPAGAQTMSCAAKTRRGRGRDTAIV